MTFDVLSSMNIAGVTLFRLQQVEGLYKELEERKATRSKVEYYFTITPSVVKYIFDTRSDVGAVTYLDSDLLFFSDPQPLFDEMTLKKGDVAIIGHRFPPHLDHLKAYGTFNVGWVTFRRTTMGMACLVDWQQKCIEWCHDYIDNNRFADQKYLDDWPAQYEKVVILDHPGGNVALWNLQPDTIVKKSNGLHINGRPLIFYHFHGLSQISRHNYFTSIRGYQTRLDPTVRRYIYGRYIALLRRAQIELKRSDIHPLIRFNYADEDISLAQQKPFDGVFLWSGYLICLSIDSPLQNSMGQILKVFIRTLWNRQI
jgi:hypothetical protein